MKIKSYKNLIVWQKAMELVVEIYKVTENFSREEVYGLISQIRRSAVSIPSNIAEGSRRGTRKDFRNFLLNSYGSGAELETQIEISKKIYHKKQINYNKIDSLFDEIMRMLNKMTNELKE